MFDFFRTYLNFFSGPCLYEFRCDALVNVDFRILSSFFPLSILREHSEGGTQRPLRLDAVDLLIQLQSVTLTKTKAFDQ